MCIEQSFRSFVIYISVLFIANVTKLICDHNVKCSTSPCVPYVFLPYFENLSERNCPGNTMSTDSPLTATTESPLIMIWYAIHWISTGDHWIYHWLTPLKINWLRTWTYPLNMHWPTTDLPLTSSFKYFAPWNSTEIFTDWQLMVNWFYTDSLDCDKLLKW